jgi:hypothetical protein
MFSPAEGLSSEFRFWVTSLGSNSRGVFLRQYPDYAEPHESKTDITTNLAGTVAALVAKY